MESIVGILVVMGLVYGLIWFVNNTIDPVNRVMNPEEQKIIDLLNEDKKMAEEMCVDNLSFRNICDYEVGTVPNPNNEYCENSG